MNIHRLKELRRKIREFNGTLVAGPGPKVTAVTKVVTVPTPSLIRVQQSRMQQSPAAVPRLSAIRPSTGQIHLPSLATSTATSAQAHSPYALNPLQTTPNQVARTSHPLYSNQTQVLNLRRHDDGEHGEDYQPPTKRPFLK